MSKKKFYSKHLEKGRFYLHNDRKGGHPAFLYKKRDKKNKYYIVMFTSSPGKARRKLKHNLESNKRNGSYAHTNPLVTKRKDLGSKSLDRLRIHKDDKPLIKLIEKKK